MFGVPPVEQYQYQNLYQSIINVLETCQPQSSSSSMLFMTVSTVYYAAQPALGKFKNHSISLTVKVFQWQLR